MEQINKLDPITAAEKFIEKHYPSCQGALLAGSVIRGEATDTSDLDLIIFEDRLSSSYRESLFEFGWRIETFVHNLHSYKDFFKMDVERARPSLPRMVSEGMIILDTGILESIKLEAQQILDLGPAEWTTDTIESKRYFITDAVEDFIGSTIRQEEIFIANALAEQLSEFVLRTNKKWIGSSKWIFRALKQYDHEFAEQFVETFDTFYRKGDKRQIILLVDQILQPYGGRLFAGYSLGKK